jgi:hypothetical protein
VAPPRPPVTTTTLVIRFLREHPGEMFCAHCLAVKLMGRVTVSSGAMFEIEGLGAERRHGRCSVCGEKRLVAGVPS